jgi:hypothetical protein
MLFASVFDGRAPPELLLASTVPGPLLDQQMMNLATPELLLAQEFTGRTHVRWATGIFAHLCGDVASLATVALSSSSALFT